MKQACVFLCVFLIPIILCGHPLAERITTHWEKAGYKIAYDYPWRSFAFHGRYSHRVQLDLSKNTLTVFTEAFSFSDGFTSLADYASDIRSLFQASGFGQVRLLFSGDGLSDPETGAVYGWLVADASTLPFYLLSELRPETQGFIRLIFDLSYETNRLQKAVDPLANPGGLELPGVKPEELARIAAEDAAILLVQQRQDKALETQLQQIKKELADRSQTILQLATLNDQLFQRLRTLEETVATYEASETSRIRKEDQIRVEREAFEDQGRQLWEAGLRIKQLESALAEKESDILRLNQLLSFREVQTSGLTKEVERQAERIVKLQSENARLTEENLRLTLTTTPPSEKVLDESDGAEATPTTSPKRVLEERRKVVDNPENDLKIRYSYDVSGKVAVLEVVDAQGAVLETSAYTYDEEGRPLRVRSQGPSSGERTETYDYSERGTVTIEFREGQTLKAKQRIEKNPEGQTVRVKVYDAKGALNYMEECFHESGLLKRADGYDASGKRVRQTFYAYDAENRITRIEIKEGTEVKWVQTFDYATTGEPVQMSLFNSRGVLVEVTEYIYAP